MIIRISPFGQSSPTMLVLPSISLLNKQILRKIDRLEVFVKLTNKDIAFIVDSELRSLWISKPESINLLANSRLMSLTLYCPYVSYNLTPFKNSCIRNLTVEDKEIEKCSRDNYDRYMQILLNILIKDIKKIVEEYL